MNAIKNYYRRIGTRAECSPAIGGLVLLVGIAVLIYIYRYVILMALVITALCVLGAMVIYAAVAVTVAYRRHVRAVAIQAPAEPIQATVMEAPAPPLADGPMPQPFSKAGQELDLTDQLPPSTAQQNRMLTPHPELADLHAASGVNQDGTIS